MLSKLILILPIMLMRLCGGGGDDGPGECPGAEVCAVESAPCETQEDCAADQACIDYGEPDARCGSATNCSADGTCQNPAETCICFD